MSEFMTQAPQITVALVIVGAAIALAREMRKLAAGSATPEQITGLAKSVDDLAAQVAQLAERVKTTEAKQTAQEIREQLSEAMSSAIGN